MYADDTIAAIATPQGQGGIGIVRISGPLCIQILSTIFSRSHASSEWTSHRLYRGHILDAAGVVLDEALAVLMRRPRSYTGENVLEFHCHGSPVVLRRVLSRVLSCGARLAEPGEFTKRAFLNGRLDLTQAEAVIDMVRARTEAGASLAVDQLSGRLSGYLAQLREELIHVKALLEAQIDFSEEDFEVDANELLSVLDRCIASVEGTINTYGHGKLVRGGIRVAIIGKPNVGKSSLLNALLEEERAIVTAVAGTTRDSIDETADFDGVPVVLSDTAGLREPAQADLVERLGMQRTAAKVAEANFVLAVIDASRPIDAEDRAMLSITGDSPRILVKNKIDIPACVSDEEIHGLANGYPIVAVSAKKRIGMANLRKTVIANAAGGPPADSSGPILTNIRHRDALTKALNSLRLARQSAGDRRPADLVAVDVQEAIDHFGDVTGLITNEEVLDRIFREFCIGK
jgi:tRNA modification GTPase